MSEFKSILFQNPENTPYKLDIAEPDYFKDLHLSQIVDEIAFLSKEYKVHSFFYTRPTLSDVLYRQEIMRDFENRELRSIISNFSEKMRSINSHLKYIKTSDYPYEKSRWFMRAVEIYCEAVSTLEQELKTHPISSTGLTSFHSYISTFTRSNAFERLKNTSNQLAKDLAEVQYCVYIKQGTVTIKRYEGEADFTPILTSTFEKFSQKSPKSYLAKLSPQENVNHIQKQILDRVAILEPELFDRLLQFHEANQHHFMDDSISLFHDEVQFYISYLTYIDPLKQIGLSFCYPKISSSNKEIRGLAAYDLALAAQLHREKREVVSNDFHLKDPERIFVISGPNQGGKTTFARMIGQLHHLSNLGCPVPGKESVLFYFDNLFSHFEREEDIETLRGKLQDDLVRIHQIMESSTSNSILIMNEIFSSTTLKDSTFLSKKILDAASRLDLIAVFVTFIDELTSLNEKTVSMVAWVNPENPATRTYLLERKPANGLAYALALAEKYGLTQKRMEKRMHL